MLQLLKATKAAQKEAARRRIDEAFPFAAYQTALTAFVQPIDRELQLPFLERLVKDIESGRYELPLQFPFAALRAAAGLDKPAWERVTMGSDAHTAGWLSSAPSRRQLDVAPHPTSPLASLRHASASLKSRGVDPLPAALARGAQAQDAVSRRLAPAAPAAAAAAAAAAAHFANNAARERPRSPHRKSLPPLPAAAGAEEEGEPEDAYGAGADEDEAPSSPAAPRLQSPRVPDVPAIKAPAAAAAPRSVKRRAEEAEGDDLMSSTHGGHEQRKRRRWTEEEELALMEGVRVHGIGCWKHILHGARQVFGERTAVDLKDKWRNMQAKLARPNASTNE